MKFSEFNLLASEQNILSFCEKVLVAYHYFSIKLQKRIFLYGAPKQEGGVQYFMKSL